MSEFVAPLLRFLGALLEPALAGTPAMLAVVGVVGLATVAAIVLVTRSLAALVAPDATGAPDRLRQTVDVSELLAQSDPDAAGRPRPRAPGRGLAAA